MLCFINADIDSGRNLGYILTNNFFQVRFIKKIGEFLSIPCIRFYSHTLSYIVFLILVTTSILDNGRHKDIPIYRMSHLYWIYLLILIYVIGKFIYDIYMQYLSILIWFHFSSIYFDDGLDPQSAVNDKLKARALLYMSSRVLLMGLL